MPDPTPLKRKRDPHRKRAILDAAARLVADRGYAQVTMADIGADVGVAASAIYWHFASKQDLLVALFDDCLDRLLSEQAEAVASLGATDAGLTAVTALQVAFVLDEHNFAKVYYREAPSLPEDEQARLRRKQRDYVKAWSRLLGALRPDLTADQTDDLVHAAIGAIQSALVHRSRVPETMRREVLLGAALRAQGCDHRS